MWAMLRVVLFEWLLARIGLRWLLSLTAVGAIAIVLLVGLPTLLIVSAVVFFLWRWLKSRSPNQPPRESAPA